jgi:molybdate transport system substrate-binding protein
LALSGPASARQLRWQAANAAGAGASDSGDASRNASPEVDRVHGGQRPGADEDLGTQFTKKTGVTIKVNPGPSSSLAQQILSGAPADLFLSASQQWATAIQDKGLAAQQQRLLTNKLVLVVPPGNPANVRKPEALIAPAVEKIALAGEKVPAGIYGDQALTKLGLLAKLTEGGKIARGEDVRSALSFVQRGEAQVGIVYATDVAGASSVEVVHEFDPTLHDEIVYALVLVKREPPVPAAKEFFDFLLSPDAEETFQKYQFQRLP